METNYIIKTLRNFSKLSKLPREVKDYIRECTKSYGKAQLVLKNNRYFIETEYEGILDDLLQLKTVKAAADAVGQNMPQPVKPAQADELGFEEQDRRNCESIEIHAEYIKEVREV